MTGFTISMNSVCASYQATVVSFKIIYYKTSDRFLSKKKRAKFSSFCRIHLSRNSIAWLYVDTVLNENRNVPKFGWCMLALSVDCKKWENSSLDSGMIVYEIISDIITYNFVNIWFRLFITNTIIAMTRSCSLWAYGIETIRSYILIFQQIMIIQRSGRIRKAGILFAQFSSYP